MFLSIFIAYDAFHQIKRKLNSFDQIPSKYDEKLFKK